MLHFLNQEIVFPPVEEADKEGLLAIGGDLSTERLLLAYRKGIFSWFSEDEPPMWWSPDPRFVLFPSELKVSKSMLQLLRKDHFRFTVNEDFSSVIRNCQKTTRPGQDGTWITKDIVDAYTHLHHLGYAHSAEAWNGNQLVGGLYGIRMGNIFFGESMFSLESNASKFAFIKYIQQLHREGVEVVDCQVYTSHLESLGARMIQRKKFIKILEKNMELPF